MLFALDDWEADSGCGLDREFFGNSLEAVGTTGQGRVRLIKETTSVIGQAAWSPDGATVAYSLTSAGFSQCGFYLADSGGTSHRVFASFGSFCEHGPRLAPSFAWDPKGDALIFETRTALRRIAVATGKQVLIAKESVYECCWVSSDSQTIAFSFGEGIRAVSVNGQTIATVAIPKHRALFELGRRNVDVHLP